MAGQDDVGRASNQSTSPDDGDRNGGPLDHVSRYAAQEVPGPFGPSSVADVDGIEPARLGVIRDGPHRLAVEQFSRRFLSQFRSSLDRLVYDRPACLLCRVHAVDDQPISGVGY